MDKNNSDHSHTSAYERILSRVREFTDEASEELGPKVHYAIDSAKEKAYELGELTREETDKIGNYVKRDIMDAAHYLSDQSKEFADWLKFDVDLVEDRLLDLLEHVVNDTRAELKNLADRAKIENIWLSDEIAGPGTLECIACGHLLKFHETSRIPKCEKCGGTQFHRASTDLDETKLP